MKAEPLLEVFRQHKSAGISLYVAIVFAILGAAGFINSALAWLLSQYFLLKYHSVLYPAKAHIYDALSLAVTAVCCAAGHYCAAGFMKRIFSSEKAALPAWAASFFTLCACTLYMTYHLSLRPAPAAAMPVIAAWALGGLAGWRLPPEKDPLRKFLQ